MGTIQCVRASLLAALGLAACAHAAPHRSAHVTSATKVAEPASRPRAQLMMGEKVIAPSLPQETAPLEQWGQRFPDAARTLIEWRKSDEEAARELVAWDEAHPEKLRVLVLWALTHRYESLGAFLYQRANWGEFAMIVRENAKAVDAFLAWVRRSSPAARELVTHRAPLARGAFGEGWQRR